MTVATLAAYFQLWHWVWISGWQRAMQIGRHVMPYSTVRGGNEEGPVAITAAWARGSSESLVASWSLASEFWEDQGRR